MTRTAELPSLLDAEKTRRMIAECASDLRAMAEVRGSYGVTADDSRRIALRKGFVTGGETKLRALSWLAAVPKAAGLTRTERTRWNAQRNSQRVYVL